MLPSMRVGTIVRNRNTSTAATTPALLPPKPISAAVRLSSMTPIPPGVIGMLPRMRASDQAANASTTIDFGGRNLERPQRDQQDDEDRKAAGKGCERENVPAPLEDVDDTDSEALEVGSTPRDRPAVEATFDPGRSPCRQVTDLSRHSVAVEDEHERSDHDAQDCYADERHRREQLVSSPAIVNRKTATIGYVRLASWFQRLTRVTDRAMEPGTKPARRNIA